MNKTLHRIRWLIAGLAAFAATLPAVTPVLTSVQPNSITVGSSNVTLTVRGNSFEPASIVGWNGITIETVYDGPTMLYANVPPMLLRNSGTASIRVSTGGVPSGPVQIAIEPTLSILIPSALTPAILSRLYSVAITTAGGSPPFRFTILHGTLPLGISLNPNTGALIGLTSATGNFEFTILVADSTGVSVSRVFTLQALRDLSITTAALPIAIAGSVYSFSLQSDGGALPHRDWRIVDGALPSGITLSPAEGVVAGVAAESGIHQFTLRLRDSAGLLATRTLTLEVVSQLAITPPAALSTLTSGAPFSLRLAATGGRPPYLWLVTSGQLPAGLLLDPTEALIAGSPSASGEFHATVTVTDATGLRAAIVVPLTVLDSLAFPSGLSLGGGEVGSLYSQTIAVAGGVAPYRVTLFSGALPAGLALDPATGRIWGTPASPGTYTFAISVVDSAGRSASRSFTLRVAVPAMPALHYVVPASIAPARQVKIGLTLAAPYPLEITGSLTMTGDQPQPDLGAVFSSGSTSVRFRFPANATTAEFEAPSLALQSGTTAGVLSLEARLDGVASQPAPHLLSVQTAAPVVREIRLSRTASGFEVSLSGFSPTKELTQAVFRFTGDTLAASEVTVPLRTLAEQWYGSPDSLPYGAQFTYRQPFTITGSASAVSSVTVTLSNTIGSSVTPAAGF